MQYKRKVSPLILTVDMICEFHNHVMHGDFYAGKIREGYVCTDQHVYPPPFLLDIQLHSICDKFNEKISKTPTFPLASWLVFNFLCLHPFGDGNGRTARVLLAYLLGPFTVENWVDIIVQMRQSVALPRYFPVECDTWLLTQFINEGYTSCSKMEDQQDFKITHSVICEHVLRAMAVSRDMLETKMMETKMLCLSAKFQRRFKKKLNRLAELVEEGNHFIEFTMLELNESLFHDFASWHFIVCMLSFLETLVRRTYCCMKTFGLEQDYENKMLECYVAKLKDYLGYVWYPWIANEGHGWGHFMTHYTCRDFDCRLFDKFYQTIQKMNREKVM